MSSPSDILTGFKTEKGKDGEGHEGRLIFNFFFLSGNRKETPSGISYKLSFD